MRSVLPLLALTLICAPARADLPNGFTNAVRKGPAMQNVASDSAVILLHTRSDEVTIDWGTSSGYGQQIAVDKDTGLAGPHRVFEHPVGLGLGIELDAYVYEIQLSGLQPDSEYHYQVTAKGSLGASQLSGDLTFRTAPLRGRRFVFAVAGDNKAEPQDLLGFNWHNTKITALMREDAELRLLLDTGDIVNDSNSDLNWSTFYQIRRELMTRVPWFPSLGNHDFDDPDLGGKFQTFVSVPRTARNAGDGLPPNDVGGNEDTELFYSYDFGGVHFITYHGTGDMEPGTPQYQFFADDLAAHRCAGPIIVYGHQPWYSSAEDGGNNVQRQLEVHPLFAAEGVDLVITGHRHFYERMDPEHPEMIGVTYMVSGGAGASPDYFDATPQPFSLVRENKYHYVRFEVDGWDLRGEAINENGIVFDTFELLGLYQNDPPGCRYDPTVTPADDGAPFDGAAFDGGGQAGDTHVVPGGDETVAGGDEAVAGGDEVVAGGDEGVAAGDAANTGPGDTSTTDSSGDVTAANGDGTPPVVAPGDASTSSGAGDEASGRGDGDSGEDGCNCGASGSGTLGLVTLLWWWRRRRPLRQRPL